jgi:hypothetical protein
VDLASVIHHLLLPGPAKRIRWQDNGRSRSETIECRCEQYRAAWLTRESSHYATNMLIYIYHLPPFFPLLSSCSFFLVMGSSR